jgi:hypothetical protein
MRTFALDYKLQRKGIVFFCNNNEFLRFFLII